MKYYEIVSGRMEGAEMGVFYIIGGVILVGAVIDLLSTATGNGRVGEYEYHFAPGEGAVFGQRG